MKWIKEALIVLLVLICGGIYFYSINKTWEMNDTNQQLQKWQDAYAKLASTHDSLDQAYASLMIKYELMDSLYKKQLKNNQIQYENIISGFDTLSIDEHIQLLSKFLSEKDTF